MTTSEERTCHNCDHWGCDPDGTYCGHKDALNASNGFGLSLTNPKLAEICPHPDRPLFRPMPEKRRKALEDMANKLRKEKE